MLLENDYGDLNYYISQYDGDIRYVDGQIKYLFDNIQKRGLLDNTIVFLTADHGEAFLEHGVWEHGGTLHDEQVHVPLIAKFPNGNLKGLTIDSPVHTFDISATILDYLEIKPEFEIQAKSLLLLINGKVDKLWEYTLVEKSHLKCLRNENWKYISDTRTHAEELYNLQQDPFELNNLIAQEARKRGDLRRNMMTLAKVNDAMRKGHVAKTMELDKRDIERLRALGYIR